MVALYDHIQELRAELSANTCPGERAIIENELEHGALLAALAWFEDA